MLATDNWCIKVSEKVYGPYTFDQMTAFASEGRLSSRSMVSPAGGKMWREARQFPPLAALLGGQAPATRSFGKAATEGPKTEKFPEGAEANFLVIFDVAAGTAGRIEPVLRNLGKPFRLTDNVWVIGSTLTALGIRNALVTHLDVREPVFVVDCSRGRTSWQNFVPELQARLTRQWVKMS